MPTEIRPRRPPRRDRGPVIFACLACAPLLIAASTGSHSVDPENYAGLAAPDLAGATRWAMAFCADRTDTARVDASRRRGCGGSAAQRLALTSVVDR